MRRLLLAAAFAIAAPAALAQPMPGAATVVYRPNPRGQTGLRVVGPPGSMVRIFDGGMETVSGGPPLWMVAFPGHVYRIVLTFPDGGRWERVLTAQPGMNALVSAMGFGGAEPPPVYAPPPYAPPQAYPQPAPPPAAAGPMPMDPGTFAQLEASINAEPFPQNKIGVLRTAAQGAYFTCAQVGQLVDLYAFPDDKVRVVALTRSGLVDPQNAFLLYGHFAFPNDKERVRRILSQ